MMDNAQYRQLAYEKAVLSALLRIAQDKYLPVEGMPDPELKIDSDDLPRSECTVPEDAIIEVLLRLKKLVDNVDKEMASFKFVKTEGAYDKAWVAERESQSSPEKSAAKGKQGKGKGGKGGPQAPATK
jgi:hypothetical protein